MEPVISLQLQQLHGSGMGLALPGGHHILINPSAIPQADYQEMRVLLTHYDTHILNGLLQSLQAAEDAIKITIVVNKSLVGLLESELASVWHRLEIISLQTDQVHLFGSGETQGEMTLLDADHHYHLPGCSSPFRSNGFLIEHSGHRIYYAGLTQVYPGLKDIGNQYKPNLSILPVGVKNGIPAERIAQVVMWLGSDIVLPFFTGPNDDWDAVMEEVFTTVDIYTPAICRVLESGEVYELVPTSSTGRTAGPEARY